MSEQPLTYESVLALIRESVWESERRMKEADRRSEESRAAFDQHMEKIDKKFAQEREEAAREWEKRNAELNRQMKETDKKISALGSRIGEIIECMVEGGIVDKFQALDYEIMQCGRNVKFWHPKTADIRGEIDLFLENGDTAILVEVKTTLEIADVRQHMERLEKFRLCADAKGDKRRFVGAVAGAVVEEKVKKFIYENGMYVIVQSGEAFEIEPLPEGFKAKEW